MDEADSGIGIADGGEADAGEADGGAMDAGVSTPAEPDGGWGDGELDGGNSWDDPACGCSTGSDLGLSLLLLLLLRRRSQAQ
jgi:MYXO-CTERM domain-containing protein